MQIYDGAFSVRYLFFFEPYRAFYSPRRTKLCASWNNNNNNDDERLFVITITMGPPSTRTPSYPPLQRERTIVLFFRKTEIIIINNRHGEQTKNGTFMNVGKRFVSLPNISVCVCVWNIRVGLKRPPFLVYLKILHSKYYIEIFACTETVTILIYRRFKPIYVRINCLVTHRIKSFSLRLRKYNISNLCDCF